MSDPEAGDEADPTRVVSCDLQGGTLSVYEERIEIDRSSASMFEDKTIGMGEIRDVEYSGGILTGHIQIHQTGVEPDEAGRFSHPIDENTLYFPRSERSCARRAHNAILERIGEKV
jgi:hypothetical protein